jgi:transcriptional regulator with XRE-family HTH domain
MPLFYLFRPIKFENMDLKVFFGINLKRYRKERHLSQEQLSEKVDISVKHLSKIERGLTFLSADLLERLSFSLGVSVAALFCKNDEKIYDENVLDIFDRITEKHLIKAIEEIKTDVRQNNIFN